jgi:2-oxoacid:acceptor oxidoreductase gamma subunit (pyruvate/2-ketoisovalerate family)
MFQVRIHGRGGQGVVTAAEIIAIAAFYDNKQSQAFPSFGVERTGAPVEAFARIDDRPIRLREQIQNPDVLIVQDATLLGVVDLGKGCSADTIAIINTSKPVEEMEKFIKLPSKNIHCIDATKIAMDILGRNIVNTVIIGAFAKNTGLVSLEAVKKAVMEKFGEKGKELAEKNVKAVETAFSINS